MSEGATAPNGWPAALLRGFRDGARESLVEIYRMHVEEVSRLLRFGFHFEAQAGARRFVGYQSAFDLQDALHETFRRAFEPSARAGYDGLRPYGPYLLAIARNVVLRGFRTREALFPAMDEAALAPHEIPISHLEVEVDPEVQVDREQMRALVQRFMDAQTPTDRDILTLRFVEGLSQRDVADHLGLGRQRVRTREARLRASLVRFLAAGERKAGLPTALAILCGGLLAWLLTTGGGS